MPSINIQFMASCTTRDVWNFVKQWDKLPTSLIFGEFSKAKAEAADFSVNSHSHRGGFTYVVFLLGFHQAPTIASFWLPRKKTMKR